METLKVGDKVYWRMRVGWFNRTLSGKITKIEGNIASVKVNTQNIYGAEYKKNVNTLTKSKKQ